MAADLIDDEQFLFVLDTIKSEAGVIIQPAQRPMLESRLFSFCKSESEKDMRALVARCMAGDKRTLSRMVGALTNGETSFFRDVGVFNALERNYIPHLIQKHRASRRLRFWSAAASTGQEAYSLAMLLEEIPELATWDVKVIGTDISESRLNFARAGIFSKGDVNRGLPAVRLLRHFEAAGENFAVRENVRRKVEFRQLNLLGPWDGLPEFHGIYLRNAMIYWAHADRASVLERLVRMLPSSAGGIVVLGAAESPLGLGARVELLPTGVPGVYTSKNYSDQP